jgi:hypothetical protein
MIPKRRLCHFLRSSFVIVGLLIPTIGFTSSVLCFGFVCCFSFVLSNGWLFVAIDVSFCLIFFYVCCTSRFVGIVVIVSLFVIVLVDLARSISIFCDLFPLVRLRIVVILSSSSLAPVGLSVSTLPLSPVSALRFDVECVVAFSSLFAVKR